MKPKTIRDVPVKMHARKYPASYRSPVKNADDEVQERLDTADPSDVGGRLVTEEFDTLW